MHTAHAGTLSETHKHMHSRKKTIGNVLYSLQRLLNRADQLKNSGSGFGSPLKSNRLVPGLLSHAAFLQKIIEIRSLF